MPRPRKKQQPAPAPLTRGELVCLFIETFCKVPEGALVGQPIVLADFQRRFILDTYDNPSGTRLAIMSMARKNAKTATTAGLLLAHLVGPEAKSNSQIVAGAMSREQAALVYTLAVKMIRLSPDLSKLTKIVPSHKQIFGLPRNVEFRALSAEATTAHGLSPVLAILDEVGQVRGSSSPFIEAITSSQGAHDAPLLIAISTQAPTDADLLSMWIDDAIKGDDPHTVCHLYAADKEGDLLDRSQWVKANPALGLFRNEQDLKSQLEKASRLPALEASARNLLLNQRVSITNLWLAPGIWKANSGQPDWAAFEQYGVHIGLDLSQKNDLTAAVLAARDDDGVTHLRVYAFTPEQGVMERAGRDRVPYDAWIRSGDLIAVPGATIDYEWVAGFLRTKTQDIGIEVHSVQFDRWRINEFKAAAERVGFSPWSWQEVGQGYKDISPRLESFETALLQDKIRHGNQAVLNLGASSAIVVQDPAGNKKLDKVKATQKIDALVAAVMAAHPLVSQTDTLFEVGCFVG